MLKSMPQTRETLSNDIWHACDILRRDNNCGGIMEYVEHLAWLLFLRFLDAQEEAWEVEAAIGGQPYQRILENGLRWPNWARHDWHAPDLIDFVHTRLIPTLQNLSGDPFRETISAIFSERNVIVAASGYNLKEVLAIVDQINFLNQDDIFTVSQVYEDLLRRLGSENRMAGEFYTPRSVIRFMVDVVKPQLGETIYDPACGSGGFLAQAFEYVQRQNPDLIIEEDERLQTATFYGNEKKAVPALLGLMNVALHGVTAPQIRRRNTLEEPVKTAPTERFDVVLTNPPFGGTEGRHIQRNFKIESNATELLFVQHIMKKLKPRPGARCGMVIPEGTLFRGGAFADVKTELLEDFNLKAVVSLPPGTFAPYSDVKTALLFFERPGPTEHILYYELPLPEGLKKFSKGSPIEDEHFEEARAHWEEWETARDASESPEPAEGEPIPNWWVISADEVKSRDYDLSARNPYRSTNNDLPHPLELTAGLLERVRELQSIVEGLHETLSNGEGEQ